MKDIRDELDVIEAKARILKALSHPTRLCIVKGLMEEEGYNVTKMQNCLKIPQSTLSQHLTKLKDMGILEGKRNGVEIKYYVINEEAKKVIRALFFDAD